MWQATREVEAAGGDGEEEEESARARRRAYAMHAHQKAAGETDDSPATGFHHIFPRPTATNPAGLWVDGNGREKIPFTFHPRPAADMAAAARSASSLQSVLALAQARAARRRGRGRRRGWAWARARAWAWPRWRRRRTGGGRGGRGGEGEDGGGGGKQTEGKRRGSNRRGGCRAPISCSRAWVLEMISLVSEK